MTQNRKVVSFVCWPFCGLRSAKPSFLAVVFGSVSTTELSFLIFAVTAPHSHAIEFPDILLWVCVHTTEHADLLFGAVPAQPSVFTRGRKSSFLTFVSGYVHAVQFPDMLLGSLK